MSNALIRSVPSAPETPTFRAPPHNFEAEQALLGAILVNNEACDRVSGFLKSEHFYDALNGRIYDHAAKLIWAGKRATPITLKTFFQGDEPCEVSYADKKGKYLKQRGVTLPRI